MFLDSSSFSRGSQGPFFGWQCSPFPRGGRWWGRGRCLLGAPRGFSSWTPPQTTLRLAYSQHG